MATFVFTEHDLAVAVDAPDAVAAFFEGFVVRPNFGGGETLKALDVSRWMSAWRAHKAEHGLPDYENDRVGFKRRLFAAPPPPPPPSRGGGGGGWYGGPAAAATQLVRDGRQAGPRPVPPRAGRSAAGRRDAAALRRGPHAAGVGLDG